MPSNLIKMKYPYDKMKLQQIFKNKNVDLPTLGLASENLKKVYGENLMFPKLLDDRPYTYSSLVVSIDGRIAYKDAPEGPFIASKNFLAEDGSTVDWWTLNVLRASADALVFGANTLKAEPEGTGHVFDEELETARERQGMNPVPWNVIPTLDGNDIPFEHKQFTCGQIPIIFYTSPEGLKKCQENAKKPVVVLGPYNDKKDVEFESLELDTNKIYIVVTGVDKYPNNKVGLYALKKMGINKLLVESPTLVHLFMQDKLIDELFLNYSCVYLGGKSLTIGENGKEFTSENHPHTELLSIYMHSPHFMYIRHKLIYDQIDIKK